MKREILFRAKRKDNGEWTEGFYVCISGIKHYILTGNPVISPHNVDVEFYRIIPETVGQFTGLTDKNGVKIFEGDICSFTDFFEDDVEKECVGVWDYENNGFFISNRLSCETENLIDNGVFDGYVIGNIYNDPELLKGV